MVLPNPAAISSSRTHRGQAEADGNHKFQIWRFTQSPGYSYLVHARHATAVHLQAL